MAEQGALFPISPDGTVKVRLKHSNQVLEFPGSMPPADIKDYLDRTYGPNRPKSGAPIVEDFIGPVREAVEGIRGLKAEDPEWKYAWETLKAIGIPWTITGRLGERLFEQGASAITGKPPASTWPSTIFGLGTGLVGPSLAVRGARRLFGLPRPGATPTAPTPAAPGARRPIAALPPAGGTGAAVGPPRVFQMAQGPRGVWVEDVGRGGVEMGQRTFLPAESGLVLQAPSTVTGRFGRLVDPQSADAVRLRAALGVPYRGAPSARRAAPTPAAARGAAPAAAPTVARAAQELGRPLLSDKEGAVGAIANAVGRLLTPVYSRMEALAPEGYEAARLLRRAFLDTLSRHAQFVHPSVRVLNRLTPAQKDQLFQHLHKGSAITDPIVAQAAASFNQVLGAQGGVLPQQMAAAGLQMFKMQGGRRVTAGPFQTRQQFFPLEYRGNFRARLAESKDFRRQYAERLVRDGQAKDLTEANRIIRMFIEGRKLGRERPSPAEFHREASLPGFITDPAEALSLRGWRVSRRLAEIEHLGHKDARLQGLVKQLRDRGEEEKARTLEYLIDIALGGSRGMAGAADRRIGQVARTLRSAQAFFKLPLAIVPQLSQSVWTAFRTDAASTIYALGRYAFRNAEARRAARELGAYADVATRQLMQEYASEMGERILGKVLLPFNLAEEFNRIIAANAGQAWARRLEAALQRHSNPGQAARLGREMKRLGFSDDEVRAAITTRGFTPDQHRRIALEIVDQTQFIPSKGGRSEFFNSETGMIFGQFKTFSLNLARMLNRVVLDEARAGNYRPAAKLLFYGLVPMQFVGEAVSDMRAVLTGRARPSLHADLGWRLVENFTSIGALGILTDALLSITSGRGLLAWMGGPTLDDANKLVDRIAGFGGAALAGEPAELKRQGVELGRYGLRRAVPYLGPGMVSTFQWPRGISVLPPTTTAPGYPKDPSVGDILGLTHKSTVTSRRRERERSRDQRRRWRQYMK